MSNRRMESGWRPRVWNFIRILNVRLRFILLMVATGLIAAQWDNIAAHWDRWTRKTKSSVAENAQNQEFYCPMHPSVIRSDAGNCPACGMPLGKRTKGESATLPDGVLGRVELSPYRISLAGIATSEVASRPIDEMIRTPGTIDVDERRTAHISARMGGRIDKLHINFTGERAEKGAPLVDLYSPELMTTQKEYLLALESLERSKRGGDDAAIVAAQGVFDSAHQRLRLWGINDAQLVELEGDGQPNPRQTILSPISGIVTAKNILEGQSVMEGMDLYTIADLSVVWMSAFVYESDISRIKVGQHVSLVVHGIPGRVFDGEISFVSPVLDQSTRTVRVRADIPNPGRDLKPGMYVDAEISASSGDSARGTDGEDAVPHYVCPMHPEVERDGPSSCPLCGMHLVKVAQRRSGVALMVPESAVIDTGTKRVVYLEREPGIFDAIEIEVGPVSGGFYPVIRGLIEGDRVVTQGAFLVDAEHRLNPGVAGSYFGATGAPVNASRESSQTGDHAH